MTISKKDSTSYCLRVSKILNSFKRMYTEQMQYLRDSETIIKNIIDCSHQLCQSPGKICPVGVSSVTYSLNILTHLCYYGWSTLHVMLEISLSDIIIVGKGEGTDQPLRNSVWSVPALLSFPLYSFSPDTDAFIYV